MWSLRLKGYTIPSGHNFRCKMAIKSVQAVFRPLASLEKTVEKCHIQQNELKNRLTFTLHCKHGLLKTHNLSFQDSESLQAVFDKDSCPNIFHAQPRLLVDMVMQFPPSLEEVTLSVSDERMWVRNHVEEEAEQSKAMLTELCLASDEFEHFSVRTHTSITFCLKELRGFLLFAESSGLPISLYFDEPGNPVVLSITESVLEVNFVLATLSDDTSHKENTRRASSTPPPPDEFMNDDMDSYLIAMDTSIATGPFVSNPCTPQLSDSVYSNQSAVANHRTRPASEGEDEDEMADAVGPPNKKFCSLFFGSVLPPASQMTTQPMTSQEVLASDSEDETQTD
ncbi:cell cycle checkpoint control protein RAD9A isoform X2 [Thalassophryne amazonica]|uniref:cell cycle checkpoint control protein RAD9A isoform X2 n=1 Tax=Thalassophryne amazonica TaxID=390379 RepID=UPI001471158C|nr:cell cycle checkpoint control protein RAD9A isoform X2 [Thalassophryne amazonica]